jgi:hypothetical protein
MSMLTQPARSGYCAGRGKLDPGVDVLPAHDRSFQYAFGAPNRALMQPKGSAQSFGEGNF